MHGVFSISGLDDLKQAKEIAESVGLDANVFEYLARSGSGQLCVLQVCRLGGHIEDEERPIARSKQVKEIVEHHARLAATRRAASCNDRVVIQIDDQLLPARHKPDVTACFLVERLVQNLTDFQG